MSTLVGTPVVAPVKAVRAVRSTRVVAAGTKTVSKPKAKAGAKKSFGEWLLDKACRDSSVIGAGYEDDLKSGKYKKGGKK
ncbi:predicted protein [Micromonas commoda]|uniref:Uncharacterized protein n=1 Tax=Micromonas commoda (strain RCC299 / NOUM17 / CCMP2709) TaxID=296587 RepID=C1EE63_MICCC|nr:predicted protein [Micromonas commoda]ACO66177.1 predicted protein [Micromonas commoda]|eukprot:XP_002504919.1 predicted protein [Micromonas commoda]